MRIGFPKESQVHITPAGTGAPSTWDAKRKYPRKQIFHRPIFNASGEEAITNDLSPACQLRLKGGQ
jgi:hypothetical protein